GGLGWYAQQLRAARARQRQLAHQAADAVVEFDATGLIVELNPQAERLFGAPAADLVGRTVDVVLPQRLAQHREAALRFLAEPGYLLVPDLPFVRGDGTEGTLDATLTPRGWHRRGVVRAVLHDVSDRQRMEAALRHTAALLSAAEEAGSMGSWEWDPRTGIQRWSNGLYRVLGLEAQSVPPTQDTFLHSVHPDDRALVIDGWRALEQSLGWREEFRVVWPDGQIRVVESEWWALASDAGTSTGVIGTIRDVTAREHTRRELKAAVAEQSRGEQSRQLLQITDVALASLPLDDLLGELLQRVCGGLPADAAALLLSEPPSETLQLRATHGIDDPTAGTASLLPGVGLAARVKELRLPLVLVDAEVSQVRLTALSEMGTVAGAPLFVGPRIIGVLEVGRREPVAFDEDDLALLQLAADRTALALDHARVVDRERHIAQTLQRSLLPDRLPDIPGCVLETRFLPAGQGQEVGGDFYDAFAIGQGRWMLVLGDVCGKGPHAAALTAMIRYTLRAEATHEPRPGQLLGLLNDAILSQRSDFSFCTAVCVTLDLAAAQPIVTIASGGHPMPLILRRDGSVEIPQHPGGPLIGVWRDADYVEERHRLGPGDTLVAYTDGLLEAHAPEHLLTPADLAVAAAGALARPLPVFLRALEALAVGDGVAPVRDDIAILALGVDQSAVSVFSGLNGSQAPPGADQAPPGGADACQPGM
ncbi:MAG TPA: SpoIIE family protein phosphatase, partial [Solirubrobacteraceae bacterium]